MGKSSNAQGVGVWHLSLRSLSLTGNSLEGRHAWETEAMINADLPPERHMRFKGIKVFAVEA